MKKLMKDFYFMVGDELYQAYKTTVPYWNDPHRKAEYYYYQDVRGWHRLLKKKEGWEWRLLHWRQAAEYFPERFI